MSSKSHLPDQDVLFNLGEGNTVLSWKNQVNEQPFRTPDLVPVDEVSVNLSARSAAIIDSITKLGFINRNIHVIKLYHDAPASSEIGKRVSSMSDEYIKNVGGKTESYFRDAEASFKKATGITALEGAGLIGHDEAEVMFAQEWEDFKRQLSGPDKSSHRKLERNKQIANYKRLSKSAAKPQPPQAA